MDKPGKPNQKVLRVERLEAREVPSVTAVVQGTALVIEGTRGNDYIVVRQAGSKIMVDGVRVQHRGTAATSVDVSQVREVVVRGHAGNDTINLSTLRIPARVWGGAGDDRVWGGSGNDTIYGDQGNDSIWGGAGNDWLVGGDGNDQIFGGAGNDWITGDAGDDYIAAEAGNDTLSGGDGRDTLSGGSGIDLFDGHGFGIGAANAVRNFDTYIDEFDLWRPIPLGTNLNGPSPLIDRGQIDATGHLAPLTALRLKDMQNAIRVVSKGVYDVRLPGDRRTIRVTFDGTWTDTDPKPTAGATPGFAQILLHRARLIAYGINPSRHYTPAEWDAHNTRTGGRLYDPGDALRQFTGRGLSRLNPATVDFNTLRVRVQAGYAAVASSHRGDVRTANGAGILGDTHYVVRRLFTDTAGRRWVELYNPLGRDSAGGKLVDNAAGSVRRNDGVITLSWDDFRRSSNFSLLHVA